ncbi:hypothetical protein E2H86_19990 [Pseudomonas putida]|uniref:LPS O-antigen chain length determinant protein WzzB n=1 Tax=Pseudomonas putida TaxID=303 RepID=UPI00105964BB|nr:Wzz/FepE/Etk N-terminal domain-containing protein [Pseudomonas putida]TDJ74438.1 hypothetical protein E2H86_19990 [Pseudomonas putida]
MRSERERLSGDDEIDLFELIAGIWKHKVLAVVTAAIVTAGAVAYAFLKTPIYEAKLFVQPPTQNDISQLNFGRGGQTGLAMMSVSDVYGAYLRNLQSESLRREFFRSYYLPSLSADERSGSQDALYSEFQEVLSLGVASKDAPTRYFIKVKLPNPEVAAEWATRYVEMAGRRGVGDIVKDVKADATVKANNLEQQINAARESTRKQREDRIARLTEALRVAKSIGLEKPPIISAEVAAGMEGTLTYMRGSKALEAEIENLRARSSDDPFVANLRQRQEALAFYRTLQIDSGVIQVYRQDGALESPDKPISPKKSVIVALGIMAGVVLGLLLAFVRHLMTQVDVRRKREG